MGLLRMRNAGAFSPSTAGNTLSCCTLHRTSVQSTKEKKHVKPLDAHRLQDQWSLIMPQDLTDALGIQSLESDFQFSPEPSPKSVRQWSVKEVVLCVNGRRCSVL